MQRFLGVALATVLLSGSAAASDFERNVLLGAGLGAGVGALIGSATGGPAGAGLGAAVGGASPRGVGFFVRPRGCYIPKPRGGPLPDFSHRAPRGAPTPFLCH